MPVDLKTPDGWPLVALNDAGIRPAGEPDACFYCRQKVGQPHGNRCVMVEKLVRLRYTIEVDVKIPYHWTKEDVEFHRNDSTWCADNALREIEKHTSDGPTGGCLCPRFKAKLLEVLDDTPTRDLRTADAAPPHDEKGVIQ